MPSSIIYLDESGDLGWTFDKPYRRGGSSRHLTIAALIVDPSIKLLPKRLVRKLYQKHKWDPKIEKKWSEMTRAERIDFATKAKELFDRSRHYLKYVSITVKKENVQHHIRTDENKLYNYMIKLAFVNYMAQFDRVTFIPDPRSIKVESGNSLHDYLQTELWFERSVATMLETKPQDSSSCINLQFADMLSGIVQHHFEDGNSECWTILSPAISAKTLFFGS